MRTRSFTRPRLAGTLAMLVLLAAEPGSGAVGLPYQTSLLGGNLTPAAIVRSCRTEIALAKTRMDAIAHRTGPRTFANVIAAIENVGADLSDNTAAATFVFQASADAAVRDASQQCISDESSFYAFESARPDLYAAMIAARASDTATTLAQRKLQELTITGAQRSGAGLAASQRREFIALQRKLSGPHERVRRKPRERREHDHRHARRGQGAAGGFRLIAEDRCGRQHDRSGQREHGRHVFRERAGRGRAQGLLYRVQPARRRSERRRSSSRRSSARDRIAKLMRYPELGGVHRGRPHDRLAGAHAVVFARPEHGAAPESAFRTRRTRNLPRRDVRTVGRDLRSKPDSQVALQRRPRSDPAILSRAPRRSKR